MNRDMLSFGLLCRTARPLPAGSTPRHWRRGLAQAWDRLQALQRASAWIGAPTPAAIVLCNGSLFGPLLATLAGVTARTDARDPQRARTPSPRLSWPEHTRTPAPSAAAGEAAPSAQLQRPFLPNRAAARLAGAGPHDPPARQAGRAPLTLARQMDRAGLARLAGEPLPARLPEPSTGRGELKIARPRAALPLPAAQDGALHARWLHAVARQVERTLRQEAPVGATVQPRAAPAPAPNGVPPLAAQWRMPLAGQRVPSEHLAHWAGPSRDRSGASAASADPATATHRPPPVRAENSWDGGSSPGADPEPPPGSAAATHPLPPALAGAGGNGDRIHVDAWSAAPGRPFPPPPNTPAGSAPGVAGALPLPETAATASAADWLSIQPRENTQYPIRNTATATIRGSMRQEAAAEDDLELLAARIKQILDEEARRHGIDV